ncbi:MAG TPA: hypothetical protein VGO94_06680, partial [Mycobacteriales bacterium]|nr:hypothetical protein [Mycobacteriales bacterium]
VAPVRHTGLLWALAWCEARAVPAVTAAGSSLAAGLAEHGATAQMHFDLVLGRRGSSRWAGSSPGSAAPRR